MVERGREGILIGGNTSNIIGYRVPSGWEYCGFFLFRVVDLEYNEHKERKKEKRKEDMNNNKWCTYVEPVLDS